MNQNSFTTLIASFSSPLIKLSILTFFLLLKNSLCVDPQFLACVPKTCGVGGPNISYPFWIQGQQQAYCGYPGFQLSCNEHGHPLLKLSNNDYIIHQIFYNNQSLLVSNALLSNTNSGCAPSIQNVTLEGDPFEFGPDVANLFLLFNCSSSIPTILLPYKINDCSGDNGNGSALALFGEDPNLGYASGVCRTGVVAAPVEVYEGDGMSSDIEEVLRRGFGLQWRAGTCGACEVTGGRCGFNETTYHFRCFCPDRPHAWQCRPRKKHLKLILVTVIPAGAILIMCLLFILWRRKKWNSASSNLISRNISSDPSSKSDLERGGVYFGVPIFSYSELEEATCNFDPTKELGDGGFGTVYHGKLRDGREVAVKRLYENNYKRVEQFMNEIEILTCLRHQNLVSLYGCTSRHSRELLLVYEYIPNGTVADHLHGDRAKPGSLTWPIRLSIAIETASALTYLHASDIIHRDVKTNNILLDNNFCVRVADFGLSRLFPIDVTHVSTAPQGTPGYVDPEYHQCYQLTNKSDVYSFGVVLIELISSMPAVDISRHRHEINLANLAINKIQNCAFDELVDPCLGFESNLTVRRMTTSVAELAFRCLQYEREMRPSMDEVLESLRTIESEEYELEKIEKPDDNVGVSKSIRPPPSPYSDDVRLLKNIQLTSSPVSVTEKWISSTTTPSASA